MKWTDGKPFTSADVVFTFNQALHSTALNKFGLPLASVIGRGTYGVTINFTKSAYTDAYYALGRVEILPEHIWQSITNPATFLNEHPVGTGAYIVTKFTPQVFELTANPHYYMPGLPHFKTIRFLAYSGNTTSTRRSRPASSTGPAPSSRTSRRPTWPRTRSSWSATSRWPRRSWSRTWPPGRRPSWPSARRSATRSTAVYISNTVYDGYAPASNPEALITPNYNSVLDPSLASASFPAASAAAAKAILAKAGIKTPLNLTVKMVAGYTDYLSDLQIIQQELEPAGINLTIDQEAYTAFISDQDNGNFQLLMDSFGYTPDPWSYYYALLDSKVATPIGKADTVGNFGRYRNPQVDSLLNTIAATTNRRAEAGLLPDRADLRRRTCRSSRCSSRRTRSSSTGTSSATSRRCRTRTAPRRSTSSRTSAGSPPGSPR